MIGIEHLREFAEWFAKDARNRRVGRLRIGPHKGWYLRIRNTLFYIGR
jgi:hypothetical protein